MIKLHLPNVKYRETFLEGLDEVSQPEFITRDSRPHAWCYFPDWESVDLPRENFTQFVQMQLDRQHTTPKDFVCDTLYWAIDENGTMLGRISIRHTLNDFLKKVGGHIGYIVRPSFRQKGIATEMLRLILQTPKAREIGKILLTCDENNLASEKTILKNGGLYEKTVDVGPERPPKKHFWIQV